MQFFQWGVIIVFVLLHFALGYFRGAAKSGYFTLVNIILSFIILWIVSGVSVANSLPQADLIAQIEANLSGSVSAELLAYLTRTEVVTLLYGLVDVFVRIVTFLILFTVVRWFVSFVGFGLLYKYVLEKHVQKVFKVEKVTFTTEKDKENNDAETIKDPVIHAKVFKKSTDRLIGGAFGAVRGLITAIFLLLPLVVLASTTNNLDFEDGEFVLLLSDDDLYELIEPLQVTPLFAGLQNSLFDWAFETQLTETQNFNLRDELNNVTAIVQRAYDAGFLSEDFDINALGTDDVEAVQDILGLVGDSGVLIAFLEVGSDLAADGLLEELTGLELSDGAATQAALAELSDIDWKLELAALGIIFEKLTAVGTIEDIAALLEDTNNLANLTEAEVTALADVLRAVADLQLIKVANVGLEYVLELEDVQANIEWLPVGEREAYLKDALAEVLNDTEFFYGENGDLYNLADLLEVVLADYGSFSVAQLLEEDALDALLTEDGEDFLNATFDEVTQVELVSALLPTAVDFALYSAFEADVAAELAEALNDTINSLDFDAEFDTFGDIIGALVTLSASELLSGDEEAIAFIDRVAQNNLTTVRQLMGYILEDSVLVNAAINEAGPVLLNAFVEDENTKTFLDTVLFDENGLTIDLGQEVSTLLDIFELGYTFTTLEDLLAALGDPTLENLGHLGYAFGQVSDTNAALLITKLNALQIVDVLDRETFGDVLTTLGANNVVLPQNFDLGSEIGYVVSLLHTVAKYVYANTGNVASEEARALLYKDIDFGPLLSSQAFKNALTISNDSTHKLLAVNFKNAVITLSEGEALSGYITLPTSLESQFAESTLWLNEYNLFISFLVGFVGAINQTTTLSLNEVEALLEDFSQFDLDIIDTLNNQEVFNATFGVIDDSLIFRSSLADGLYRIGAFVESTYGYKLEAPVNAFEDDMVKNNELIALFKPLLSIVADLKNAAGFEILGDATAERTEEETADLIALLQAVDKNDLVDFAQSQIILGLISNLLTNEDNRNTFANLFNDFFANPELLNTPIDIDRRFFDFTNEKYGLYSFDVASDMYVMHANDLADFLLAITRIDYAENEYTLDLFGLNDFIEVLDLIGSDGKTNLEVILESEFVIAFADKVLNVGNQPYSVLDTFINVAKNFVAFESDLLNNIPLETSLFVLNDSALNAQHVILASELLTLRDIADVFLNANGLFTVNTLDDLYADGTLDILFESNILMSYASNAIQNEALQAYAIEVANDRQDVGTIPTVYVELDSALLDENGFILVTELEALADVVYVFGLMDIDTVRQMITDLVATPSVPAILTVLRGYAVTDDFDNQRIDVIVESNIVYTVIAQYLDNEDLDNVLLPFLPETLVATFGNVDLSVPSDLKADEGFSTEYISRAELKALLTAATYIPVDPTTLDGNVFNFITDLIGQNVNPDTNEDNLDRFLASGYLREKLSRLFLSEAVLDLFGETPESFILPTSSYVVVDQQRRLTSVELRNLVEAFAVLEITTIDELEFSFAVFTALTPSERETVLESAYLFAVVDGLIQNQQSVAIPQSILDITGEISQAEILAVIEAVAFLQISDVTSLEAAITLLVNSNDPASITQLNALTAIGSTIVNDLVTSLTPTP
jgi:hypothetical protein